ncbi:MAG: iron-containing redox enzyme family protein [Actinomycetota bacterium]|nr:iron-containing redox enzyme family protein [Actinomycetota bacterium]
MASNDLVAVCQIGMEGVAKLELARNYWDEMGRGQAADVHAELHAAWPGRRACAPYPARSSRSKPSSDRCWGRFSPPTATFNGRWWGPWG